ncbi:odorant receptor 131-2-like [Echeneis naucrates]|uniref:odorant receptor 131-2-like n=1 Tax=Echeneis naucrates TaxID=173247 RepID=UPI00111374B6|nr:odorant receptor 131-2-like [Echeneis naucrates]XP_029373531.1 odorant receptor 131-2-like [Echeneis naucrates]
MAGNTSLVDFELVQQSNEQIFTVQVLVMIFLCINLLLITTFFQKQCFYATTRYILFAVSLLSDSLLLFLSDILLLLANYNVVIQVWLCVIICVVTLVYTTVTPVTLTAMTLERYVAVCMPLHHGELCSTRNNVNIVLFIHALSSVPCIVILSTIFGSASLKFYTQFQLCAVEFLFIYLWQQHLRSAISQFYFLIMLITVVISYVKIMKVAKAASGEDKQSSRKGLRTVALHGFQLLLCLIQLWCSFIEAALLQIDVVVFYHVRYFNYILFYLVPKFLSPLIYGLRDEVFFHALKKYVSFGLYKGNNIG